MTEPSGQTEPHTSASGWDERVDALDSLAPESRTEAADALLSELEAALEEV